jgi:hypothetical protein
MAKGLLVVLSEILSLTDAVQGFHLKQYFCDYSRMAAKRHQIHLIHWISNSKYEILVSASHGRNTRLLGGLVPILTEEGAVMGITDIDISA